ncbi:DNA double-strand break repair nuclease NurA [Thermogladius sp. 4427co]|uniref:DNA double-strand break repair nuclease NurA n=1 Tax=Thermogladius sp. 4427co TaxID=3450718 RepID=UPI003F7B1D64
MDFQVLAKIYEIAKNYKGTIRLEESRAYTVIGEISTIETGEYDIKSIDYLCDNEYPPTLIGVDSSSRIIDTPYLFIVIGAATGVDRMRSRTIDIPDLSNINILRRNTHILVLPEVNDFDYRVLDEIGVNYRDPLSRPYPNEYNKGLAIEEHRVNLENSILEVIARESLKGVVLLDGPLYLPTHPVTEARRSSRLIEVYKENWTKLMKRRIELVKTINNTGRVYGIVKRLQYTHVLSRDDPFKIRIEGINDQAYLSILAERRLRDLAGKVFAIGPLYTSYRLDNESITKTMWYIILKKRYNLTKASDISFFRVEVLGMEKGVDLLKPVAKDSFCTGTTLPLSILIADQRVKKITEALAKQIGLALGIPRESTLQYISL